MTEYSVDVRRAAARLMERGLGWASIAKRLAMPEGTVRKWVETYRACGSEVLFGMGSEHRAYDYETKLAAVRDHLEDGMPLQAVMSKHGIASRSALQRWAKAYRDGGPEALRPRPKGRPRGARSRPGPEPTREQELEAENRKLRAEVAYLKKLRALEAEGRARGTGAR